MEKKKSSEVFRSAVRDIVPQLVKLLGALVLLGCLFPLFYTAASLGGFEEAAGGFLYSALLCVPLGFFTSWTLQRLVYRRTGPSNPLRKVGGAIEILLGLAAGLSFLLFYPLPVANWKVNLFGGGCLAASNVLMYHLGRTLVSRTAYSLLHKYGLIFIILSFWGALVVRFIAGELGVVYSVAPLVWLLLFVLLGYMVAQNQSSMDQIIARRNLTQRRHIGRARCFNLAVLFLPTAAAVLLFLVSRPLAGRLTEVLEWLRTSFLRLLGKLPVPDADLQWRPEEYPILPPIPEDGGGALDKTYLPYIVAGVVLLLLVIFHRQIAWMFREFFRLLKDVSFSKRSGEEEEAEERASFYDLEEKLNARECRAVRRQKGKRFYVLQLQRLKRIREPEKKVRYGYGLMRQAAIELGSAEWKPSAGDSPREITGRLRSAGQPEDLRFSGGIYEAVRYGGLAAGEQEAYQVEQEAVRFLQELQSPHPAGRRSKKRR